MPVGRARKIALIAAGYAVALLLAFAAVAIQVAMTSGPAGQASSGMLAFGDSILFLAVFGMAAIPPTAATLYFLRPYPRFWFVLGAVALGIAATGIVAFTIDLGARKAATGSILHAWSALAVLRVIVAPGFAFAFLLSGLLAPNRTSRIALLIATAIEGVVFAATAIPWLSRG